MGESLTIHSLVEMHRQNNFNAIPRIACMVRNNKRVVNERDPETPMEMAMNMRKYDLVKYLRNHNAKINFNFNTNNIGHIKKVVEIGIKPTTEQFKKIIKKLLSGGNKQMLEFFVVEYNKKKQQNKTMKQISGSLIRKRARLLLLDKDFRKLPKEIQVQILTT
jgi:ankyrin repeat protein